MYFNFDVILRLTKYRTSQDHRIISVGIRHACSSACLKVIYTEPVCRCTQEVPIPCSLADRHTLIVFRGPWRCSPVCVCVWSSIYTMMDEHIVSGQIHMSPMTLLDREKIKNSGHSKADSESCPAQRKLETKGGKFSQPPGLTSNNEAKTHFNRNSTHYNYNFYTAHTTKLFVQIYWANPWTAPLFCFQFWWSLSFEFNSISCNLSKLYMFFLYSSSASQKTGQLPKKDRLQLLWSSQLVSKSSYFTPNFACGCVPRSNNMMLFPQAKVF